MWGEGEVAARGDTCDDGDEVDGVEVAAGGETGDVVDVLGLDGVEAAA